MKYPDSLNEYTVIWSIIGTTNKILMSVRTMNDMSEKHNVMESFNAQI